MMPVDEQKKRKIFRESGVDLCFRLCFWQGLLLMSQSGSHEVRQCWPRLWLITVMTGTYYCVTLCAIILTLSCLLCNLVTLDSFKVIKCWFLAIDSAFIPLMAVFGNISLLLNPFPHECMVDKELERSVQNWLIGVISFTIIGGYLTTVVLAIKVFDALRKRRRGNHVAYAP